MLKAGASFEGAQSLRSDTWNVSMVRMNDMEREDDECVVECEGLEQTVHRFEEKTNTLFGNLKMARPSSSEQVTTFWEGEVSD